MIDVYPESGHVVLDPNGNRIYLPLYAIVRLRRLGLLRKGGGTPQISASVYGFMKADFDTLTDGLRRVLGEDASGPAWVVCNCRECRGTAENRTGQDGTPVERNR